MGMDRGRGWTYRWRVQRLQGLEDGGEGLVQLELVLLAWNLRMMEEELGEAPSSKEEDEAEVEQLTGVDLQRPPVKLRRGGGA